MNKAVFPGSFDPITFGHIDIIKRASKIFDFLIVGVLVNKNKKALFSVRERIDMIEKATEEMGNVKVAEFDGLLTDFAKAQNANHIIRGLRTAADFEYEINMEKINKLIYPDIENIYLSAGEKLSIISSTAVKEIAAFGGDIHNFVPEYVEEAVKSKFTVSQ